MIGNSETCFATLSPFSSYDKYAKNGFFLLYALYAPKDIIISHIIKMEEYMADQVLESQAILERFHL